jgi:hypothetical protein
MNRSGKGKNADSGSVTPETPTIVSNTVETVESAMESAQTILQEAGESVKDSFAEVASLGAPITTDKGVEVAKEIIPAAFEEPNAGTSAKPKKGKKSKTNGSTESSQLPSTTFSPSLPSSLPVPSSPLAQAQKPEASPDVFNENHKRPAPTEFNTDIKGPLSPPSKGVKFEDGLSPGQGKDGETVIPGVGRYTKEELANVEQAVKNKAGEVVQAVQGKAKSNAVERTVWTLIMIAFFLGESSKCLWLLIT